MRDPDFLPSQIQLLGAVLLTDTMGHAERESAAALIVATCQMRGDQWAYVKPEEIAKAMDACAAIQRAFSNPLYPFPDFRELVEHEYAEFERPLGYEYTDPSVRFTLKGLRALRRWLAKPCPKCGELSRNLWWTDDPDAFLGMTNWRRREEREVKPVAGGWAVRHQLHQIDGATPSQMEWRPIRPKVLADESFNIRTWTNCREIFDCPLHGEFGLVDGGAPFFYQPDVAVLGPNGETVWRM